MKSWIALILSLLVTPISFGGTDSEAFKALYEKEWAFRLKEFPTLASGVGNHDYDDRLTHVSQADQQRRYEFWKGIRTELAELSCENLDRDDCINFRMFKRQMNNAIAEFETRGYLIPFNSDWGFYMAWSRLPQETDFVTLKDYRNYLARLAEIPVVMDEYIELMREGLKIGMTQPRIVLDGRDKPIKTQLVERLDQSGFFHPFMKMPESIANGERAAVIEKARNVISDGVIPAYQ